MDAVDKFGIVGGSRASVTQPIASAGKPFVCNICKKTYTRLDHLGRHYRSHTSERPFTCDECGKSFSRIDLLKRHRTSHLEDGHVAKRAKAGRHRATKACFACAEAKLKCNEIHPCPRCVSKGITCEVRWSQPEPEGDGGSSLLAVSRESAHLTMPEQIQQPTPDDMSNQHSLSEVSGVGWTEPEPFRTPPTRPYGFDGRTSATYDLPDLPTDSLDMFNDAAMGDFLRDIMQPAREDWTHAPGSSLVLPDVLDFAFESFLDIPSSFPERSHSAPRPETADDATASRTRSGYATPTVRHAVKIGQQAFRESMWLWTPASGDNRLAEQSFLTLADEQAVREGLTSDGAIPFRLSSTSRDRLLSMILRTCEPIVQRQVVSSFPSVELLSIILSLYLMPHPHEMTRWIHFATLNIDEEGEELLASLLATAAAASGHPRVRRLGFAVQEAARIGIADRFEEDNRNTRELRILQAYALQLHAGFWSGVRRKMEIAESFTYPIITMLRRAGQFRSQRASPPMPKSIDDDSLTENMWMAWVHAESFKRLAYHILIQDALISMALLSQPMISPSEFTLELPRSAKLWQASSAVEWKNIALELEAGSWEPEPTVRDCLGDLSLLESQQSTIDVRMTLEILISNFWSRVWQFRQMRNTPCPVGSGSHAQAASAFYQELILISRHLRIRVSESSAGMSPDWWIKLELCVMHLHVSLEDIQLLAGKEGEGEARRIVPLLKAWVQSSDSRQALFHACQVLKAAAGLEPGSLQGFDAVVVYHASLTMWAYGVLKQTSQASHVEDFLVKLDGHDSLEVQRFLLLGKGLPCITDYSSGEESAVLLTEPSAVMDAVIALLASKSGDNGTASPMLANVSKLMSSLGKAASVMKRAPMEDHPLHS